MKLSTQPYKGTRDFYPDDMRLRNWMFDKWRQSCESFGYEEYDGPILEPLELFASKTSDEIVNEQTYSFTDRGDRKVVMRPEMSPTVSRMVAAKRQELGYPLRLYSIPNCFRYERPQKGRLREFWQLNADIFGVDSIDADIEIIMLADTIMKSFGAKPEQYEIRIGSRAYLDMLVSQFKIKSSGEFAQLVDKKDKMSSDAFKAELKKLSNESEKIIAILNMEDQLVGPGFESDTLTDSIGAFMKELQDFGIKNIKFMPTVARGFDYYTDIVFEVFDTNPDNNRSMFGGGRYDGLVGTFGVEPVPTVGFGMGDATFLNFLQDNKLIPDEIKEPETELYIVIIGDVASQAQDVAQHLRKQGVKVAVDLSGKKIEKQIKNADKKGIKNVLFVGEQELDTQQFKLKNIETGTEQTLPLQEIAKQFVK